jgi:hypothetical protein
LIRVCGYRLETTAKFIAVGLLESGRIGRGLTVVPANASISDVWSTGSEPEGSIKGSIPIARWRICKGGPTKKQKSADVRRFCRAL